MRYIMYKCNSVSCTAITNGLEACNWFLKVLICQESKRSDIFQSGHHLSNDASPKNFEITLGMQRFIKERASVGEKPARVMNDMVKKFSIEKADPKKLLSRLQTRVRNYRKNVLNDNDFVDEMETLVQQQPYLAGLGDNVAFSFGYSVDNEGKPKLGKGTEEQPLVVGFATKTTIRRMRYAANFMTHLDATFKLNTKGFPVIAIDVSDMWRQFHLVSMFLVSDVKQPQWEVAIQAILDMYLCITGEATPISFVMMDADSAQRNAFDAVALQYLDVERGPKFMMCFFHVMKNVKKHSSSLSKPKSS